MADTMPGGWIDTNAGNIMSNEIAVAANAIVPFPANLSRYCPFPDSPLT